MKTHLLSLLVFCLYATPYLRAETYSFKEPISRSGTFSATGKVSLHNINGSVTIDTWDKNEIRIEGEKSAKTEEELKLIEMTIELSGSLAEINVRLPKRPGQFFGNTSLRGAVNFKITIPATASLDGIKTVNGSVNVDGVRGKTRVETVNGQVRAMDLGGDAFLKTVNGQVDASFRTLAAHQDLEIKAVNGSIKAALPSDAGIELRSSVVNGQVDSEFPLKGQNKARGKRLAGTIGDGRATLKAETVNGSIHLEKR